MSETRIFFKQGTKPHPLLMQLRDKAKGAADGTAVQDCDSYLLSYNTSGFCALFPERLVRVPGVVARLDPRVVKAVITQSGLPLDPAYSPFLGYYRGEGDFEGCWATVDMNAGKKGRLPEVTIDMTVKPNKRDELPLGDFYAAIRSRQVQPVNWYQEIPREYRLTS